MALAAGRRLGRYQILAAIGAGGMGEVYRARDTKLHRDVALKILPEMFAADPDRLARFEREAQFLASLNDQHIAGIYGIEEASDTQVLVLELVEGLTLSDRLAQGPIAIDEAIPIARQICQALEVAHGVGIIHRDLKPANIKVRPDGTVKVLDFGLAKALDPATPGEDVSNSPTFTSPAMTRIGVIMGTAAYLCPEQARGRVADKRADIWAFGCVLFEMLSARRAFPGESVTDTLALILTKDPDWTMLPPETPASIRRLLRRCLEKDRARRLADIADARLEIEEAGVEPVVSPPPERRSLGRTALRALPWLIAAASLTALSLTGGFVREEPAGDPVVYRSSIAVPGRIGNGLGTNLALSPDGRRLAFVVNDAATGRSRIWLRSLDSLETHPLAGGDDGRSPFWSPDSRWLAFVADGKLKKIDVFNGLSVTLCDGALAGGAWRADDVILFTRASPRSLMQVRATGGTPTAVTTVDPKTEGAHVGPFFLGDRYFGYVALGSFYGEKPRVYVTELGSSDRRELEVDAPFLQYAQGFLWYARGGTTLVAQPVDASRGTLSGEAVTVAEQLRMDYVLPSRSFFSVSAAGAIAFQTDPSPGHEMTWFDRRGTVVGTLGPPGDYGDISISPDGRRVVASIGQPGTTNRDVWIFEVARGVRTRFTFDPAREIHSAWSPDSSRIVFDSQRKGHLDLFQKSATGAGSEEVLFEDDYVKSPLSWSSDGRFILFQRITEAQAGLWVLPLQGDRKPFPFLETFVSGGAQFSPDGRWIAYSSNESGRQEVYVAPFPGPGGKWLVSTDGGVDPRWRTAKEIVYIGATNRLMSASIAAYKDRVEVGAVKPLFAMAKIGSPYTYDVSPDGQRILVLTRRADPSTGPLTLVVNWPALLKK